MTLLSWIDVSSPMCTLMTSARMTAPNQMLERAPICTSPTTVALSATKAEGSITGRLPAKPRMRPRCSVLMYRLSNAADETMKAVKCAGAERAADEVGGHVAEVVAHAPGDEALVQLVADAEC